MSLFSKVRILRAYAELQEELKNLPPPEERTSIINERIQLCLLKFSSILNFVVSYPAANLGSASLERVEALPSNMEALSEEEREPTSERPY